MTSRVLVTGATGFLGRAVLAAAAIRDDLEAVGLGGPATDVGRTCDLRDPGAVAALLREVEPDGVLHLAAIGVRAGREDADRVVSENVAVATALLHATTVPVVVASSVLAEDASDPYGRAKRAVEDLVVRRTQDGRPGVAVRLPVLLGPDAPAAGFVGAAVAAAIEGRKLALRDPGRIRRWLDVDDAATLLLAAVTTLLAGHVQDPVVAVDGWRASVRDVTDGLRAAAVDGATPISSEAPSEPGSTFGWRPRHSPQSSLERAVSV